MVVYQVDIQLADTSIKDNYLTWLSKHVNEMLELEGFQSAQVLANSEHPLHLSIRYQVSSRDLLEHYFQNHASKMRAEGIRLFQDKFTAKREIFDILN